jgi:hypothetical protein
MNINYDSIEILEEKLNSGRIDLICRDIAKISNQIWCISLRKCLIND